MSVRSLREMLRKCCEASQDMERITFPREASTQEIINMIKELDPSTSDKRYCVGNGKEQLDTYIGAKWVEEHETNGSTVAFSQLKSREGKLIGRGYEYRNDTWVLVEEMDRNL
jgi:hypothetical protein